VSLHVGLDLGGTNIKTAVLERSDGDWSVLSTDSTPTEATGGPEAVASNLVLAGIEAISGEQVETLGLGVPGHFDRETGQILLFPNLPGGWEGFPLRDRVASGVGMDIWMVNDARAFTLAEGLLGPGKGHNTVACITLGTGVGGGLMIEGKLHRGAFGVAGELGHQTVLPDGPLCGCGNRGCVEALVRADVLAADAEKASPMEVFEGAGQGDDRCVAAVSRMAYYLGIGLANVVTILGPDCIVVGGGIAQAGELVMRPIADAVRSRVTLVPTDQIEIVPATFGHFAGAVGAALAGALRP
jgi:glucokinase